MKTYSIHIARIAVLTFLSSIFVGMVYGDQLVPCEGSGCRACDVVLMIKIIINFAIMIGSLLGTITLMYAGFILVTARGNMSKTEQAKSMFTSVVIGVIILVSGYLIVNTIMQMLVGDNLLGGGRWDYVKCVENLTVTQPGPIAPGATVSTGGVPGIGAGLGIESGYGLDPGGVVTEDMKASTLATLRAAGVTVSAADNANIVGVSTNRLNEIAALAQRCAQDVGRDCGVSISSGVRTAGNVAGVGIHGTGAAVDLKGNSAVFNEWMRTQSGMPQVASFRSPDGRTQYTAVRNPQTGTKCTWEGADADYQAGRHWHCQP